MPTTTPAAPARIAITFAALAIVAMQAALGLYLGLPGQLSSDSIVQLYEGRTLHFVSMHPPLTSLLLGALDRIGDAPVLFVLISQALLSAATWLVLARSRSASPWRLLPAAVILLNPVVLIYVGIVWKDVLLAHAAVLLFLLIARWRRERTPMNAATTALALTLLVVTAGARQQGPLFALPAALWAASLYSSKRARVFAAIALIAIPIAATRALDRSVRQGPGDARVDSVSTGWQVLVHFDIAGLLANGGALPADAAPAVAAELQRESLRYSPYRVDTLTGPVEAFWAAGRAEQNRLWRESIAAHPRAYLQHRARHFATLVGLADMRECLPIHTGIGGPVHVGGVDGDLVARLGFTTGPNRLSQDVYQFSAEWVDTPLFMHAAYAAILSAIAVWLRRERDDVLLTLALCALAFLASYFVVGIACDFRYGYTLTVTTTMLAAYTCLAVRFRRS